MYCGLGTTGNKVRWTLAALFLLLAVLAAIGIGITKGICDENLEDARDQIQSGSGSECFEEVENDTVKWNIGREGCSGALGGCTALGAFILALAAALLLASIPFCCMCCCASPPVKSGHGGKPDSHNAHVAAPPPGGYEHSQAQSYQGYDQGYAGAPQYAPVDPYATPAEPQADLADKYGAPHTAGQSYAASGFTDSSYGSAHVPGGPGSNAYSFASHQYAGTLPPAGGAAATGADSYGGAAHYERTDASSPYGTGSAAPARAPVGGMVHTIGV